LGRKPREQSVINHNAHWEHAVFADEPWGNKPKEQRNESIGNGPASKAPVSTKKLGGRKNMIGRVKWFNEEKGFGFITSDEGDLFVHYKGISGEGFRTLESGQKVQFDKEITAKGLAAINVTVV
jgi:CspA family cold shock protein